MIGLLFKLLLKKFLFYLQYLPPSRPSPRGEGALLQACPTYEKEHCFRLFPPGGNGKGGKTISKSYFDIKLF
jgi:hypothetical protein